jgi:hypothetical protein
MNWFRAGQIERFNENVEKNQLMKSQPLNMVSDQLDWPPERVPPLIELVLFFTHRARFPAAELPFQISAPTKLSIRSAGKILDNLETPRHLAGIDFLQKQFGELFGRAR